MTHHHDHATVSASVVRQRTGSSSIVTYRTAQAARDHQALVATATERLVKELLPVLDDLERALEAAAEHEEVKLEEGVRLVHRELSHVLQKEGLAAVETDGKFDPHEHEALLTQPRRPRRAPSSR